MWAWACPPGVPFPTLYFRRCAGGHLRAQLISPLKSLRSDAQIYQGDSLPEVALSVLSASNVISDAIGFVMEQMARAGQREAALAADAQSDAAKLKHENGRLSMQLRTDTAALEARLRQASFTLWLLYDSVFLLQIS